MKRLRAASWTIRSADAIAAARVAWPGQRAMADPGAVPPAANRDEALRCLAIAQQHMQAGGHAAGAWLQCFCAGRAELTRAVRAAGGGPALRGKELAALRHTRERRRAPACLSARGVRCRPPRGRFDEAAATRQHAAPAAAATTSTAAAAAATTAGAAATRRRGAAGPVSSPLAACCWLFSLSASSPADPLARSRSLLRWPWPAEWTRIHEENKPRLITLWATAAFLLLVRLAARGADVPREQAAAFGGTATPPRPPAASPTFHVYYSFWPSIFFSLMAWVFFGRRGVAV